MTWAGVSWRGKAPLVILNRKIDAVKYCNMLDEYYQLYVEQYYPNGNVFQQNGAPAHTATHKREYFMEEAMTVVDWPSKSPDMNIVENVWGLLSRRVYQDGRQFTDEDELKECLIYEWKKLSIAVIRRLALSVPRRVLDLITRRGSAFDFSY